MTAVCEPTLPKPCTSIVEPSRLNPRSFAHSRMQNTSPCPVAFCRPSVPPLATGLPVTTPFTICFCADPTMFMYVSIIHAMVWLLVPTSGAGMSYSGPMFSPRACVKRRVIRWSSCLETECGSNLMPPLPPPNGRRIKDDFHVIIAASALTSSSATCGW